MTKRVILTVPEGLTFDQLTEQQQAAVQQVFGQHVNPMPSTKPFEGRQVVDAITIDEFDPSLMAAYGITDWEVLAMWEWDYANAPIEIEQLDEENFRNYLHNFDDEGNELPGLAPFRIPHKWSGWD